MATNYKFTLKRNNGTDYDELYPKTTTAQVDGLSTALSAKVNTSLLGVANGVATLDGNGLIPASQLSAYIRGGIRLTASMGADAYNTVGELLQVVYDMIYYSNGAITSVECIGVGFIASQDFSLTLGTLPTDYAYTINPGDEGDTTLPIALEAGDMIIVSGYSFSDPTHTWSLAVINNTYGMAGYGTPGIVSKGQFSVLQDCSASTEVIDGTELLGLVKSGDLNGNTDDYLAHATHTHSQYQPADADLTAIAGLTASDGNIIVGNGSTWVAESGDTARTSLGLAIGTDVQAYDAGLASIAGLTTAANNMIYATASDTYATTSLTAFGRSIIDDADASTARTTLGLAIGTDVQGYNAHLAAIAGLAITDSNIIVGDGSTWVAESGATARTSLGVYSTTEVDNLLTHRPTIFYNTTEGAVFGSLIVADVTAI